MGVGLATLAFDVARMTGNLWIGRDVLLTGHTGFKGAWMAVLLRSLGARVHGIALPAEGDPALWPQLRSQLDIREQLIDIRDQPALTRAVAACDPDLVIHMAAQSLVRRSYEDPCGTFATNVVGCANLLEALRPSTRLRGVLVVTSDKVYANPDQGRPLRESDPLGGGDPYSCSKAAAELVVQSFAASFFDKRGIPLVTARGGNVIGGGDWAVDRIVPDIYRAVMSRQFIVLRYPNALRPWQHVLDCLHGYLLFLDHAVQTKGQCVRALNFGPEENIGINVRELTELIGSELGHREGWRHVPEAEPREKMALALDASLARETLSWRPRLTTRDTIHWTADWYRRYRAGTPALELIDEQIKRFDGLALHPR